VPSLSTECTTTTPNSLGAKQIGDHAILSPICLRDLHGYQFQLSFLPFSYSLSGGPLPQLLGSAQWSSRPLPLLFYSTSVVETQEEHPDVSKTEILNGWVKT